MRLRTLSLLALAACGTRNPPVAVAGPVREIAALVGDWDGTYASPVTGRTGTISFTLAAGGDSAFGAVTMIPTGLGHPLRPWQSPNPTGVQARSAELLTIRFVRLTAGRVRGALLPYADPETGAPAHTRFEGTVVGDTVEGTFTTRYDGSSPSSPTGTWRVVRRGSGS
ncbi:MAG TPA: hypothetical protein VGR60_06505 [Gemmatimonadales bacterium]|nr:hypothetical protein [Gemmatimonadales bacterium]